MTGNRVPLGILDLVPVVSGSDAQLALCHGLDLVQVAEQLGYHRYWFAEHHLNSGVAGSAPALLIAMAGAKTEYIRLGSGGVQSGHRTALSVVEEFGLLDAMYPGRIDLGVGRSGGRTFFKDKLGGNENGAERGSKGRDKVPPQDGYADNGLLIPAAPSLRHLASAPRIALTADMLQQNGAETAQYGDLIEDILGLLEGSYRSPDDLDPHPIPGAGAQVEPWILGSSPGESAAVAGRLGLRFAASYHISPASALNAARAYREAFVPSRTLERPYVAVSADVVVAPDDETARHLAAGYAQWVLSIRRGEGAIPFPTPEEAIGRPWTSEDEALVHDRVASQFVGSAATVVQGLERLQEAAQADEIIVTTITHSHQDRVRSFALLAHEWGPEPRNEACMERSPRSAEQDQRRR
jgi:alkanesulfonate monooxygenase SsuD/methylene tetrahydromethanopterin reductase-like flavin-dependent oxidoreductase (luciferase family)